MIVLDSSLNGISASSLETFARKVVRLIALSPEVSVLITDSARVRALNRRFRRKDKATDVLSFPRQNGSGRPSGDIAISAEIAATNALRYGHAPVEELKILILHGMLHLAGYDHERDNGEMATREDALRKRLGLPGSLIDRSNPGKSDRNANANPHTGKRRKVRPIEDFHS